MPDHNFRNAAGYAFGFPAYPSRWPDTDTTIYPNPSGQEGRAPTASTQLQSYKVRPQTEAELPDFLNALKLTVERREKLQANPLKKIPDDVARRCERYLKKPRGWLDETRIENTFCEPLPQDMRDLLHTYLKLSESDKVRLSQMAKVLLGPATDS